MPYQPYQGPGWAQAFIDARAAKQQSEANKQRIAFERARNEQLQEQQRIAQLLPEARQYAAQGRPEMLGMLAPDEVRAMDEAARQQEAARNELAFKLSAEKRAQRKAALGGFQNEWIGAFNQLYGELTPEKVKGLTPDQIAAVGKAIQETQTRKTPKTNVTVGANGELIQALTKGEQSKQQGKIIDAAQRLKQLDDIDESINNLGGFDKMTDYFERGKRAFQNVAEKTKIGRDLLLTDEDKKAMEAYSTATANISGFSNKIINELSGAAVSAQEWQRLVKSLPNPETDGMTQLKAKLKAWRKNIQYIQQFGIDALFNGIRSGAINPSVGAPLDTDTQTTKSSVDLETYARAVKDLSDAGQNPETAISRFVSSGKINTEQARELRKRLIQNARSGGGVR
jgi:hypothetical protein